MKIVDSGKAAPAMGSAERAKPWEAWRLHDWNERLFDHFFSKRPETADLPVVNLLVTSEELASAVRDPSSDPKEIRDALIGVIKDDMAKVADFVDRAMMKGCNVDSPDAKPGFFAHLVVSCIAAAESSDELAMEGSYRERLRRLVPIKASGASLGSLPFLWEKFQKWLASPTNQTRYRQLVLPPTGTHTLIGYSEGLAFPDRKDQLALSCLLKENGIVGEIPPPGPVISLVGRNIGTFKESFRQAFFDFRTTYHDPRRHGSLEALRAHRFWSAVVEATLRGRGPDDRAQSTNPVDLVATYDGEALDLSLLAAKPTQRAHGGWEVSELPTPLGDWRYAVIDAASQSSRPIVSSVFSGELQIRSLSPLIRQGLIPLATVIFDYLGVARTAGELRLAQQALVRDDLIDEIISKFGGRRCCDVLRGWSFVEGLKLHTIEISDEQSSRLDGVWLLHRQMAAPRISLSEGIRSDDGWIGYAEALPKVCVEGASHVTVGASEMTFSLSPVGDGEWRFPFKDLSGEIILSAFQDEKLLSRLTVQFVRAPADEGYKQPRDLHSYYVEGVRGSHAAADSNPTADVDMHADVGVRTGRVILLGAGHGEFVSDEKSAAWKVIRTGPKSTVITLPDSPSAGTPPAEKATVSNLRRRWRTLLEQSVAADGADLHSRLTAVKRLLHAGTELRPAEYSHEFALPSLVKDQPPVADEVPPFVAAIAGRACLRTGIPFAEWRSLMARFLKLPEHTDDPDRCPISEITRSWMEAGYVDVVTSARWPARFVFPLRPSLAVYRCGSIYAAALIGLALPRTNQAVRAAAAEARVAVDERRSPCRFVPSSLVVTSPRFDLLERIARASNIPLRWTKVGDLAPVTRVENGNEPPHNYEMKGRVKASLSAKPVGSVILTRWDHDRLPSYWKATDGTRTEWSFDKNAARILGCDMASVAAWTPRGTHELMAENAYLPLPLARYAALIAPVLPGCESLAAGAAGHIYTFGTRLFRDEILAVASKPQL